MFDKIMKKKRKQVLRACCKEKASIFKTMVDLINRLFREKRIFSFVTRYKVVLKRNEITTIKVEASQFKTRPSGSPRNFLLPVKKLYQLKSHSLSLVHTISFIQTFQGTNILEFIR